MFSDKTALVTGGGSGIGRGLAVALAREGAKVIVADIREAPAKDVAEEIKAEGGEAIGLACDVSDYEAVAAMKARANDAFGVVSFLFANAGASAFDYITDMIPGDVAWIVEVNMLGVSHCLQAFLPDMIAQKSGHVVATASMAGLIPGWLPAHAPYTASKAGVIGMMFNLRPELAPHNVGCMVLCPGAVTSNMTSAPNYRPARFGGPRNEDMKVPDGLTLSEQMVFRPPEQAARMTFEAMRKGRMMALTDGARRDLFMRSYVDEVMLAFDDVDAFDKAEG